MTRYRFSDVFQENLDGSLTPKRRVKLGPATMGPGVTFREGVSFGGANPIQYKGYDIEGEEHGDVLVITGFIPSAFSGISGTLKIS